MHKIYNMIFASIYKAYLAKIERKGREEQQLKTIIWWLCNYNEEQLLNCIKNEITMKDFFEKATINPRANLIKGSICGVKIQEIEDPLMKKIRYLDKLVDELAKGKDIEKILR